MKNKETKAGEDRKNRRISASLTLEAALVMPLFLYFIIAFLYFIQIFILQERIQTSITQMGFSLAKTAYVYEEFSGEGEAQIDASIFDSEFSVGLQELTYDIAYSNILKLYAVKYLDTDQINQSCIHEGFDGISFSGSKILEEEDCIDIVVRYQIRLPLKLFLLQDMPMLQRVRLRAWTGFEVPASYQVTESEDSKEDTIVYITETGKVYHKSNTCSHIKLSVSSVIGIPSNLRNENGAKYYPCEYCCTGKEDSLGTYYITSDGTRYHSRRDCPKIKRNVKEIALSEVGNRTPCKRCGN